MKRLVFLFLALLVFTGATLPPALRDNVLVKTNMFTIVYSEVLEQPKKVEYIVQCTESKFSRDGLDFFTCDSIKTSDNADYANNEYDKGHMAPAAAFSCNKDKLKNTFTYINCALQQENLNRGVWRFLETYERNLAKTGTVKVTIELHYSKSSKVLSSGATVPDGFTKTIVAGNKTEKYYFPNIKPIKKSYTDYKLN
jgi:endonuclease G